MTPTLRRMLVACVLSAAIPGSSGVVADEPRRPISEADLFRFAWAGDPQVAPDGSKVAFVRVAVDRDKDDYETSIWSVPAQGGEPRRLTNGPRDAWPRWSPDGSRLLFLRRTEGGGKVRPNAGVFALDGRRRRAPEPDRPPRRRLQPRLVARRQDDRVPERDDARRPRQGSPRRPGRGRPSTARATSGSSPRPNTASTTRAIATQAPRPRLDRRPGRSLDDRPTPKRLTSGPFDEAEPTWSPDSRRRIYFTSSRATPSPTTGPIEGPSTRSRPTAGRSSRSPRSRGPSPAPSPSPDGRKVAFRGTLAEPSRSYTPADLFVVDCGSRQRPSRT